MVATLHLVLVLALACTSTVNALPLVFNKAALDASKVQAQSDWTCDPLDPSVCLFPFPNNFFRDEQTKMLNLTSDAIPRSHTNQSIDPRDGGWTNLDGFSPIPMILAQFPNLDLSPLPQLWNVEKSMASDSPSVLVNLDTGDRIAHWCELDHSSDQELPKGYDRALIMWPAERLNNSHTYAVGFRHLVDTSGKAIDASGAFAALRDGTTSSYPSVTARRDRYNKAIFPALAGYGFTRDSLVLAWEFTVMSTRTITNRLVTMRDDAFERTKDGISFRIEKVDEKPRAGVARELHGVMTVPWYLNQLAPGMSVRMTLDSYDPNVPVYNGEGDVQFLVSIPESLVQNGTRGAIMQYGHGLFGSMSEIQTGYLDDEANRYGYVLIATNWLGMCWEDEVPVASLIAEDLSDFPAVPDRSHQGMLNALLLMRLASSDAFVNHKDMVFNGKPVINPAIRYYYGNSQGGIFGAVYMAITNDVQRGVLGVAGAPYALLLPRSADFAALFDVIKVRYPDPGTRIALLAVMELLWNRLEPAGYLHHISRDPLPNTPGHTVIGHYGLGDAQVTWLGMLTIGRSIGAHMFESNVREGNETLFGFPFIKDTDTLSTPGQHLIQGWDFGAPQVPFVNVPAPRATDAHEKPRRTLTAQEQTHRFLTEGVVYNACGGACHGDGGYL